MCGGSSSAAANHALRAFVAAWGDQPWTPPALAELGRLRSAYLDALRAEQAAALGRGDVAEAA